MNTSKLYMEHMRHRARAHVPPNFARKVIQTAERRRHARVQFRVAAITGAICVLTAISVHWVRTDLTQRRNLEVWNQTAAQVRVLEESI
jgi:hypothetical protein